RVADAVNRQRVFRFVNVVQNRVRTVERVPDRRRRVTSLDKRDPVLESHLRESARQRQCQSDGQGDERQYGRRLLPTWAEHCYPPLVSIHDVDLADPQSCPLSGPASPRGSDWSAGRWSYYGRNALSSKFDRLFSAVPSAIRLVPSFTGSAIPPSH